MYRGAVIVRDHSLGELMVDALDRTLNVNVVLACSVREIPQALAFDRDPEFVVLDTHSVQLFRDRPWLCRLLQLRTADAALLVVTTDVRERVFPLVHLCELVPAVARPFPVELCSLDALPVTAQRAIEAARLNRAIRTSRRHESSSELPGAAFLALDLARHSRDVMMREATGELEFLTALQDDYLTMVLAILSNCGAEAPEARKGDEAFAVFGEGARGNTSGVSPLEAAVESLAVIKGEAVRLQEDHRLFLGASPLLCRYDFHIGVVAGQASRLLRAGGRLEYIGTGPIRAADLCHEDEDCQWLVDADDIDTHPILRPRFSEAERFPVTTKRGVVWCYALKDLL